MSRVSFGPQRRQPDPFSCGAAAVVVARMLQDPEYADRVELSFDSEVIRLQTRLVTGTWMRRLGSPPWSVAWAMESLTGREHHVRPATWQRVQSGTAPMPLLIGSGLIPRHYLLITQVRPDRITVYDPDDGELHQITEPEFTVGAIGFGRWPDPLWLISD